MITKSGKQKVILTMEELKSIESRAEKATKGPWEYWDGNLWYCYHSGLPSHAVVETVGQPKDDQDAMNIAFIAHARQDVPELLEYIAALEAEVTKLNFILSAMQIRDSRFFKEEKKDNE